jgi:hypothetical protein
MGVSDEAKNVIPLKFLRKIKNKIFFPLVNSIRGHTVYENMRLIDSLKRLFIILSMAVQFTTGSSTCFSSPQRKEISILPTLAPV